MFNPAQIKELLNNKNVDKCSPMSITYNSKFKLEAVRQYYEDGFSPRMIFKEAGFDLALLGKGRITDCLRDWKRIYNHKGKLELAKENRGGQGGRSKTKYTNDKETALIPGKVLSDGDLTKKITIAAWAFSEKSKEKIKQAGGKTISIQELMKDNPDGKNIRILG